MSSLAELIQWDIGLTAVDVLNKIGTLIKVTSQDKVHPQACLAAIEIGDFLECSPKLIGQGKEALCTKSNLRSLHGFGIILGLLPKSTATYLSTSSGGVKVFLLVCGLKLWLKEAEAIGDVLFEVIINSDTRIQDRVPTSASDLSGLMDVLLAYTPQLTENLIERSEQIGSDIQRICGQSKAPRGIYDVPPAQHTAALFTKLFQSLRNQEISRISLKGSVSATWFGILLPWLLPNDFAFVFRTHFLWGKMDAKIAMELEEPGDETAELRVQMWTEASLEALIHVDHHFERSQRPRFIPQKITRNYLQSTYDFSKDVLDMLGVVGGVIVRVLVEMGHIDDENQKYGT